MSHVAYKARGTDGKDYAIYFQTNDLNGLFKYGEHLSTSDLASDGVDFLTTIITYSEKENFSDFPNVISFKTLLDDAGRTQFDFTFENGNFIRLLKKDSIFYDAVAYLENGIAVGNIGSITKDDSYFLFGISVAKNKASFSLDFYYNSNPRYYQIISTMYYKPSPFCPEDFFTELKPFIADTNPYSRFGNTETDPTGGDGDGYETGDAVSVPSVDPLNSMSALGTGMLTVYSPTKDEMKSLYQYLWSDTFDVNSLKKIWANPFDVFMGFSVIPCTIPTAGTKEVVVGNQSTGVQMTVASQQYIQLDCGTLEIKPSLGAYTDFEPFTKVQIYLPYCGTYPLSMDDINSSTVHVVYNIDIISGSCTAIVELQNRTSLVHDATYPDAVIYEFTGNMAVQLPLTGNDYRQMYSSMISFAGKMAGAIGAATAGNVGGAVNNAVDSIADTVNMKPVYNYGGNLGSNAGRTAVQTPYLIFTQPVVATPERQNTFTGLPSWFTATLGDLSGFTKVHEVHLSSTNATESERNEIYQYLESGVIL